MLVVLVVLVVRMVAVVLVVLVVGVVPVVPVGGLIREDLRNIFVIIHIRITKIPYSYCDN